MSHSHSLVKSVYRLNSYLYDTYKTAYSSIWGWWSWYTLKPQIKALTYERCFRCHDELPSRDLRRKFNMDYCDSCYDGELQELFSAILKDYRVRI